MDLSIQGKITGGVRGDSVRWEIGDCETGPFFFLFFWFHDAKMFVIVLSGRKFRDVLQTKRWDRIERLALYNNSVIDRLIFISFYCYLNNYPIVLNLQIGLAEFFFFFF